MPNTVAQSILLNRQTSIDSLVEIKNVVINRASPIDLDVEPLPAVFIYRGALQPAPEARDVNTKESWLWSVELECWARDTDMENLFGLIYQQWYLDRQCGGFAIDSELVSQDLFDVDPNKSLFGFSMTFEVLYRHQQGDPYTL